MTPIRSVCVYCGSSPGRSDIYRAAGHALGRSLAESGIRLVYGGGTKGIMGAVADGAIEAGGKVTGIIPRFLITKEATEQALGRLDELHVTENMHERKHRMFEESDAFVTLPGGIGTVEEIVEIMTWAQLGHHAKPMVFVNVGGFWNPMLALIRHMREEGFVHTGHRVQPLVVETPEAVVPAILAASAASGGPSEGVPSVIDRL
ncbi:MAG: TIGR00730 family Rossman fold protein [Rhizobiaceae bacterium]|nr:TIGR00730 family Rossman fold protein [Rhizobiaceae bacterium]